MKLWKVTVDYAKTNIEEDDESVDIISITLTEYNGLYRDVLQKVKTISEERSERNFDTLKEAVSTIKNLAKLNLTYDAKDRVKKIMNTIAIENPELVV